MSKTAKLCPRCGHPNKRANHLSGKQVFGGLALAVFGIWFMAHNGGSSASVPPAQAPAAENQQLKEIAWIRKGKEAVQAKLKDPASAQFKDVVFVKKDIPVSCGQVNSKNSFGGYAGFEHFISAGSPESTYLESEVKDFADLWNKLCATE